MLKKIVSMAGLLAMTGGFALASTGTAAAEQSQCPTGAFCAWYLPAFEGSMYYKHVNGTWTEPVKNDDMSWYNHGTPQAGVDHVRVYDAGTSPDQLTLCIHQGASGYVGGEADDNGDMERAKNRGNYHRWGGECGAGEPDLD